MGFEKLMSIFFLTANAFTTISPSILNEISLPIKAPKEDNAAFESRVNEVLILRV